MTHYKVLVPPSLGNHLSLKIGG